MSTERTSSVTTWKSMIRSVRETNVFFCFSDYRPQPELDVLSESGLDDASEYTELSVAGRRAAEREMDARDDMALGDDHVRIKV